MRKPQVIPDEDHEVVCPRAAAVDVAKASGVVCVRTPGPGGRYASRIWEVPATTARVLQIGQLLVKERVQLVTLEATSDYWRIWFYLLESLGLKIGGSTARDVVSTLVRLRPLVSLTPGAGSLRGR